MSLPNQITKTSLLIPYEQLYIQLHYHHKELVPEKNTGEYNPMYQLIFTLRLHQQYKTDQYYDTLPTS